MFQEIHSITDRTAGFLPLVDGLIKLLLHPFGQVLAPLCRTEKHLSSLGAGKLRQAVLVDADEDAVGNPIAESHPVLQVLPLFLRQGAGALPVEGGVCLSGEDRFTSHEPSNFLHLKGNGQVDSRLWRTITGYRASILPTVTGIDNEDRAVIIESNIIFRHIYRAAMPQNSAKNYEEPQQAKNIDRRPLFKRQEQCEHPPCTVCAVRFHYACGSPPLCRSIRWFGGGLPPLFP